MSKKKGKKLSKIKLRQKREMKTLDFIIKALTLLTLLIELISKIFA